MKIYAILMAGGVGARFWPRSRNNSPKQVLNIVGKTTMIQDTVRRLQGLVEDENILIVTNALQKELIKPQLPMLNDANYIIEPYGKNTAPCIGLAAIHLAAQDPQAVMVVLPADHVIENQAEFQKVIRQAAAFAMESGGLITLGITPYEPATGYGYIYGGETVSKDHQHGILKVKQFLEKPDLPTAKEFFKSGDYFWNSGMFIWTAAAILEEISKNIPDIFQCLMEIKDSINSPQYPAVLESAYGRIKGISIDYGVMQEAQNVFVIPADMGWNDVGSWETVHDISDKDKHANAGSVKDLIDIESDNNYIYSPDKTVALVGVDNLVIVDTGDALLVCRKSYAQDVKKVVDALKEKGAEELL